MARKAKKTESTTMTAEVDLTKPISTDVDPALVDITDPKVTTPETDPALVALAKETIETSPDQEKALENFRQLCLDFTVPYSKKRKKYKTELKGVQKEYAEQLTGTSRNKDWRKEWAPILSRDQDYDGWYLINLILYKLEKMKLHLEILGVSVPDTRAEISAQLTEAITLGKKVRDFDYSQEAHDFLREHVSVKISTTPLNKDYTEDTEKTKTYTVPYDEVADAFDDYTEENCVSTIDYMWDTQENEQAWNDMLKKAEAQEQYDTDKFFLYISQHLKNWWD